MILLAGGPSMPVRIALRLLACLLVAGSPNLTDRSVKARLDLFKALLQAIPIVLLDNANGPNKANAHNDGQI